MKRRMISIFSYVSKNKWQFLSISLLGTWSFLVSLHNTGHYKEYQFIKRHLKIDIDFNTMFCTGSIFTNDIVVSAAHCLKFVKKKEDIFILANSMYSKVAKSQREKIHEVKDFILHENFICLQEGEAFSFEHTHLTTKVWIMKE